VRPFPVIDAHVHLVTPRMVERGVRPTAPIRAPALEAAARARRISRTPSGVMFMAWAISSTVGSLPVLCCSRSTVRSSSRLNRLSQRGRRTTPTWSRR